MHDKNSDRYVDVKINDIGEKVIDNEAQDLLCHLKNVKIPEKLSEGTNIFYYKVRR